MTTTPETGTIDNPVTTTVPAEHYTGIAGPGAPPSLIVSVGLASLGVGSRWEFDSILAVENEDGGTTIVLLCYPDGDDEGWDRVNEVGEW